MSPIPFSGNPLDRAANLRREAAWVEGHLGHERSRFLPFVQMNALTRTGEAVELAWLDAAVRELLDEAAEPMLLGVQDGIAHFAVDVSSLADPLTALGVEGAEFSDARRIAVNLPEGEAGILAQARALLEWHSRHRFCGSCGQLTRIGAGGGMRVCTSCGAEHFPGPHPVVIMVVWRGDRCLLGRGKGWGGAMYSALAGFVDVGETLEEAVAREVYEEAGLRVDGVVYHSSQPWPFPLSLMLGCFAHVADEEINVDPEELAEARWFSREEIRAMVARAATGPDDPSQVSLPGPVAIAHHICRRWSHGLDDI